MSKKIALLSEEVINRIAAGEVVENPASLLKELIENSLDAEARQITVWIEGGGEELIRIEDDGCGMGKEDARLSLERHATSKIRSDEDLQRLHTMGFRGEALAAIAAVSRLDLKTSEGGEGSWIQVDGGKIGETHLCVRNRGTTIEVRSLFFNVPARKKFLKLGKSKAVVQIVETIALANPEVAFTLFVDGKKVLELFPTERKKRIEEVMGQFPITVEEEGVWGLFSAPGEAKAQRREQILFVNKRPLFSPLVAKAVKMGYGTRIEESLYPPFVLFLSLPPEEIDVNVHPQKKEVRFSDERKIFRLVERVVSRSFETPTPFVTSLTFAPPAFHWESSEPISFPLEMRESKELGLQFEACPIAVMDGFLFVQTKEIYLVDLSLAFARVLYDSISGKKEEMQRLIWPFEWEAKDEELLEELSGLGMECRLIGKKKMAIDAIPARLDLADLPDFLELWMEKKRVDWVVCECVRKKKKNYSLEQAFLLWKELQNCQDLQYDPQGKKIWTVVDRGKLKKMVEE
ncbi:MAG TPA: DNA mismatch repair endonuclease MutL [Chlamydiales bacterium]|nr:DNA mismatch repair endonuclease MutL [Chlamydiales bacterium]